MRMNLENIVGKWDAFTEQRVKTKMAHKIARVLDGRSSPWDVVKYSIAGGLSLFALTGCDQCNPNSVYNPTIEVSYQGEIVADGTSVEALENSSYSLDIIARDSITLDVNFGEHIVSDNLAGDTNPEEGVIETTYAGTAPAADETDNLNIVAQRHTSITERNVGITGTEEVASPSISEYTFDGSAVTDLIVRLSGEYPLSVTHSGEDLDVRIDSHNGTSFDEGTWENHAGSLSLGEGRYRVHIRSSNSAGSDIESFEVVGADFNTSGLAPGEYQHNHDGSVAFDLSWTDLESLGLDILVKTMYNQSYDDRDIHSGTSATIDIDDVGAYTAMMFVMSDSSGLWIPSQSKSLGYTGLNAAPTIQIQEYNESWYDAEGDINVGGGSMFIRRVILSDINNDPMEWSQYIPTDWGVEVNETTDPLVPNYGDMWIKQNPDNVAGGQNTYEIRIRTGGSQIRGPPYTFEDFGVEEGHVSAETLDAYITTDVYIQ